MARERLETTYNNQKSNVQSQKLNEGYDTKAWRLSKKIQSLYNKDSDFKQMSIVGLRKLRPSRVDGHPNPIRMELRDSRDPDNIKAHPKDKNKICNTFININKSIKNIESNSKCTAPYIIYGDVYPGVLMSGENPSEKDPEMIKRAKSIIEDTPLLLTASEFTHKIYIGAMDELQKDCRYEIVNVSKILMGIPSYTIRFNGTLITLIIATTHPSRNYFKKRLHVFESRLSLLLAIYRGSDSFLIPPYVPVPNSDSVLKSDTIEVISFNKRGKCHLNDGGCSYVDTLKKTYKEVFEYIKLPKDSKKICLKCLTKNR
ncbi:hypothetical protein DLAC_11734 [Tieghemostelium lacteum]|uniref:Uncharacterized protein n=1 Tax=Tieghemostelium lacteum TaxID=361077 RepID=A0A151Z7X1_TIELA|nr:hypothetical protein DLAC_11734 [Tieghemostelium lacteum]|eukprot:KYQ90052.1 hypothetical protein DLAC_11734 [Tieghemostelium lacteum]